MGVTVCIVHSVFMYNAAAAATASVHLVIYLMGCVTVLLVRYTYS